MSDVFIALRVVEKAVIDGNNDRSSNYLTIIGSQMIDPAKTINMRFREIMKSEVRRFGS